MRITGFLRIRLFQESRLLYNDKNMDSEEREEGIE